jgi:Fur family ferric uptake transcriptional regulator
MRLSLGFILALSVATAKLFEMPASEAATWTDHVHSVLARAGLKRGGARERIIDLLAGESCALSAVDIEDALRAQGTPAGRASVYRVLELLADHGLVERVAVGHGLTRFERTQPDGEHHHHLVCDQCGKLVAFDDPALEQAIDSLSERLGVRVEHHDVVLRGACEQCE